MGVIFHWFKEYKIRKDELLISFGIPVYDYYIEYIGDCGSTSHSYGNRSKLQDLFEKVHCMIPVIPNEICDEEPDKYIKEILVEPVKISQKCQELLDSDFYLEDMEERIRWIKDLSDKGYYVAYDML